MSIFRKNETAAGIQKKLDGLRAGLAVVEEKRAEQQALLDGLVAEGGDPDKAFRGLGTIDAELAARREMIARVESELAQAQRREEYARDLKIAVDFKRVLEGRFQKLAEIREQLNKNLSAFIQLIKQHSNNLNGLLIDAPTSEIQGLPLATTDLAQKFGYSIQTLASFNTHELETEEAGLKTRAMISVDHLIEHLEEEFQAEAPEGGAE